MQNIYSNHRIYKIIKINVSKKLKSGYEFNVIKDTGDLKIRMYSKCESKNGIEVRELICTNKDYD